MRRALASGLWCLCALLPAAARALDTVRVTPVTSFHYYAEEEEAGSGGLAGWPPVRYPSAPPLYARGETGAFLYGTGTLSDARQPRGLNAVPGLFLLPPSANTHYRAANLRDALQLGYTSMPLDGGGAFDVVGGIGIGNLVRLRDGGLVGAIVPARRLDVFNDSGVVKAGALYRTEFDGANGRLIAATVGQLVHPLGVLVADAGDNVYGVDMGPQGNGRIFRLGADGGFSVVHEFAPGADGMPHLPNGLTLGTDGWLYGVTGYRRGMPGAAATPAAPATPTGTLYRVDPADPSSFAVLHAFTLQDGEFPAVHPGLRDAGNNGAEPALAYVVDGGDGWLYGTTSVGSCLSAATPAAARYASTGLEAGQCGRTYSGRSAWSRAPLQAYPHHDGPRPFGTVYRIRKDGSGGLQLLHVFSDGDGANPRGPLVLGKDGAIYGTTLAGGAKHSWQAFSDGPRCTIVSLCGPDQLERPVGNGTLYRIVPQRIRADAGGAVSDGGFEHLHDFDKAVDGKAPVGLSAGADGNLYGATLFGGAGYTNRSGKAIEEDVYGTLFQVSLDGSVQPASVSLTVTPAGGDAGTVAELTWTSYLATNCVAASSAGDWTGPVAGSGSIQLAKPTGVYYYSLSCDGDAGAKVSAIATLRINAPATAQDGNSVSYGNGGGGAAGPLALLALGAAALWRRRAARRGR
ncbi:choice-of-anchor tandem repeat GloVer-containing protein [Cupriavidus sp. 30B13]|uniref:choice-of-anchor tandem repeat GloVer-containing protein n=1 Tax=Cupriavidus sp. 30B13 TaxID=3384241 RepID=UPI003B8FC566